MSTHSENKFPVFL